MSIPPNYLLEDNGWPNLEGRMAIGLEVHFYWTAGLHSHLGYGMDDPLDSSVTPGLVAARPIRNQCCFANIIWDVTESLDVGFEISHWETSYANVTPIDIEPVGSRGRGRAR